MRINIDVIFGRATLFRNLQILTSQLMGGAANALTGRMARHRRRTCSACDRRWWLRLRRANNTCREMPNVARRNAIYHAHNCPTRRRNRDSRCVRCLRAAWHIALRFWGKINNRNAVFYCSPRRHAAQQCAKTTTTQCCMYKSVLLCRSQACTCQIFQFAVCIYIMSLWALATMRRRWPIGVPQRRLRGDVLLVRIINDCSWRSNNTTNTNWANSLGTLWNCCCKRDCELPNTEDVEMRNKSIRNLNMQKSQNYLLHRSVFGSRQAYWSLLLRS